LLEEIAGRRRISIDTCYPNQLQHPKLRMTN
jgi:hypothetical protein